MLASAPSLAERLRTLSDNVIDAPNVADTELFAASAAARARSTRRWQRCRDRGSRSPARSSRPSSTFRCSSTLARARPAWSFALVGPVGPGDPRTDVSALAAEPNVHLLGARPTSELPEVLRAADAGLIPYARNALTESVFPMKVYEYLAAGLPVVATPLPALATSPRCAPPPTPRASRACSTMSSPPTAPERRAERSRAAAAHSWERRLEEIAAAIDAL